VAPRMDAGGDEAQPVPELGAPRAPVDPELEGANRLLSQDRSYRMLEAFLSERGWELLDSRAAQVLYRPTRACTVRYSVRARRGAGTPRHLTLSATSRRTPWEIEGMWEAASSEAAGSEVRRPLAELDDGILLWAWPFDPRLPGLAAATRGPIVREALELQRPAACSVSALRYRPGQRAALRYSILGRGGRRQTLFAKVVSDGAMGRIFDAYATFRGLEVDLAEPSTADRLPGVALFPAMAGHNLRDLIEDGGMLPSPGRLVEVIEQLAEVDWIGEAQDAATGNVIRTSGRLLAHLLPHRASEIRDAYRLMSELASHPLPDLTVHGDFYEGQVFVRPDFSIGLIDLEDGGPGDPLMDAANLLAHMDVIHYYEPSLRGRSMAYRQLLRDEMLRRMGGSEAELDWREAACLFLLATGPFRVQSTRWPSQTEELLDWALDLLSPVALAAA